ncbi:MAG: tetratricopeptide repeat protein, partial [Bacteroidota bacterium]
KYLGRAYGRLSGVMFIRGAFDSVLVYGDSAIRHLQGEKQRWALMSMQQMLGMAYTQTANFDSALVRYQKGYDMAVELGDTLVMGVIQDGMGQVHHTMHNYLQAEQDFQAVLALFKGEKYAFRRAMTLSNMGSLDHQLEQYEAAIEHYQEAIDIQRSLDNKRWTITTQANMAASLSALGRDKEALPLLKAQATYYSHLDPAYYAVSLAMLGDAYRRTKNWGSAEAFYQKALDVNKTMDLPDTKRIIYQKLSEVYLAQQNYQQAYNNLRSAQLISDTLYDQQTIAKVQELTQKFEAEKREAEIAQLSAENALKDARIAFDRKVRTGLIVGLGLLAAIAGLIWFNQQQKLKSERALAQKDIALKESTFQQTRTELELKALRAQMNPHFIFNCMNAINRLILEEENEKASRSLTRFARLIRLILEHSERETISLQEELEMLETYLQLEVERVKGHISYQIDIDPDLDTEEVELPSMVLQPFIENAIWHGLMNLEDRPGHLQIRIQETAGFLHCIIEDNGIGREKALALRSNSHPEHRSMAMQVTRDRLSLLGETQQQEFVRIIDLKDAQEVPLGTRVEVNIPVL